MSTEAANDRTVPGVEQFDAAGVGSDAYDREALAGSAPEPAGALVAIKILRDKSKVVTVKCGDDGPYHNGDGVHIWDNYNVGAQQYIFEDGFIKLAANKNKVLTVASDTADGAYLKGTPIILWDNANSGTQKWVFEDNEIKMECDRNKVMTVATFEAEGPYHDGTDVVIWDRGNVAAQQFGVKGLSMPQQFVLEGVSMPQTSPAHKGDEERIRQRPDHGTGPTLVSITDTDTDWELQGMLPSILSQWTVKAAELKAAGFSTSHLRACGFGAVELRAVGFGLAELKAGAFQASDLRGASFSARELKAAGFSTSELCAAGFRGKELMTAGDCASELRAVGLERNAASANTNTADDRNATGCRCGSTRGITNEVNVRAIHDAWGGKWNTCKYDCVRCGAEIGFRESVSVCKDCKCFWHLRCADGIVA